MNKLVFIILLILYDLLSFGQKVLPQVQVEQIKEISADVFENRLEFIEEMYSYLTLNFDSINTKSNVLHSNKFDGICTFKQDFTDIKYELDMCALPNEKHVTVEFHGYTLMSIQKFIEHIVKTYDIDEVSFKWNEGKTKYFADVSGMELYFKILTTDSKTVVKHYFRI